MAATLHVSAAVGVALAVRPTVFFVVGVLPPLLMVAVCGVVGATSAGQIARPKDGVVQAVLSGLSRHAGALVSGYALCLGTLALRQRFTRP